MGYIYLITNTVNNKKYVGQTLQDDVKKRWSVYKRIKDTSIGTCFYNGLKKYTPEKFKFQIICVCFDEDCNRYEEHYIKKFNCLTPNGYNMLPGGTSFQGPFKKAQLTDEQKRGLFGRDKGIKSHNFEKHLSYEQKKILSEKFKGRKINKTWDTFKSYKVEKYDSDHNLLETFESLTSAAKTIHTNGNVISKYVNTLKLYHGFYWKATEVNDNIDNLRKYSETIKKKVQQFDLDDNFIREYNSLSEAANIFGSKSISPLSRCVSDDPKYLKHKTFKGFKWKLA